MAADDDDDQESPDVHVRHFLVDLGFDEGEQFCSRLLDTDDFRLDMLRPFGGRGAKSMGRTELAAQIAARMQEDEINIDAFMLAYCKQPRTWLSLREGTKGMHWEPLGKGKDFLTKRRKTAGFHWYGPFGKGDERWYVVTKNVPHLVETSTGHWDAFPMRWQVAVQVAPTYAALHWNNSSTRDSEEAQTLPRFPYWDHIPQIFSELSEHLSCEYNSREPNLSEILLHFSFDRYFDDRKNYHWVHKAVRSSYQSVALSATGGGGTGSTEERVATGLQILTESMAKTAAKAIGKPSDKAIIRKIDHALLRHILREWGTRAYEFLLKNKNNGEQMARMRVYLGNQLPGGGGQPQDAIQHVRCYLGSGGSTKALEFILSEQADFRQFVAELRGDDDRDEDKDEDRDWDN